ncbi:hypothetical protein Neosp_007255 [[Neocosmospora] mangrovei]
MNAQAVTDLNNSLQKKFRHYDNRHVKAWILAWDGRHAEEEERKGFENFLSDTLKIKTKTVKIRALRDPAANLAANLGSCSVLIMYYFGTGAVIEDGPVWKPTPTPASKPPREDNKRGKRPQGRGVPQQQQQQQQENNELHWSELKTIIAGLNRETLLIQIVITGQTLPRLRSSQTAQRT